MLICFCPTYRKWHPSHHAGSNECILNSGYITCLRSSTTPGFNSPCLSSSKRRWTVPCISPTAQSIALYYTYTHRQTTNEQERWCPVTGQIDKLYRYGMIPRFSHLIQILIPQSPMLLHTQNMDWFNFPLCTFHIAMMHMQLYANIHVTFVLGFYRLMVYLSNSCWSFAHIKYKLTFQYYCLHSKAFAQFTDVKQI